MAEAAQNNDTDILRRALEVANRRGDSAEQQAREADRRARAATVGQLSAQERAVDSAIEQAQSAQSLARQKWTTLQQEAKFEDAAAAMQEMSEASSSLTQLKAQKAYLTQQREQAVQQQQQPRAETDPLEGYSPAERTWVQDHPAYLSDPLFQARINEAANGAVARGHTRGSSDFFEAINRVAHPERFGGENQRPRQQAAPEQAGGGDAEAFSDTGESNDIPGEHTRSSPMISATPEAPEMRVGATGEKPTEPQERAIGRGGNGLAATAAAPSRRIQQLADPVRRGQASLSREELEAAIEIVTSIEPMTGEGVNQRRKTVQEMAETYYAWAHSPSNTNTDRHTGTRRAKNGWAREAILA